MYGDDTWLKLFPGRWLREDGVTSFFAKDTVVVDRNVTRHLEQELDPDLGPRQEEDILDRRSVDWDLLLLHYLGLDHVGHTVRPPALPHLRSF